MMSGERCMGVLGIRPEEGECLTAGQKDLLESMGAQLAMALEREELRAERARTRLMEESENCTDPCWTVFPMSSKRLWP